MSGGETAASGDAIVVGVDVGGTKVALRAVRATDPAAVVAEARVATPEGGGEAIVTAIAEATHSLVAGAPGAVGVGIAGLVSADGVVRYSPNLPGVEEYPLGERLGAVLGCPVVVDNDATAATLAEWRLGAGAGCDDLVLVTLGTGIGAGVVLGGQIQRGAHGFAGEPGHMVVDPGGARCACGRLGCWEAYASGSALARMAADAVAAGDAPVLAAMAGSAATPVSGEQVAAAVAAGDEGAGAVLDRFAWWVALGVANLVNVLDCSAVVIGGGLVELGDRLLHPVRRHLPTLLMGAAHRPEVVVLPAALGPAAGAVGAALAAAEAVGVVEGGGGSVT